MKPRGIREIAILGGGDPTRRREIVEAIWNQTEHALLVDLNMGSAERDSAFPASPIQTIQVRTKPAASIRPEICRSCGRCLDVCPSNSIHRVDGRIEIDRTTCKACGSCLRSCPRNAIGLEDAAEAILQVSAGPHGRVVHGRLMDGSKECLDLIRHLLDVAREEARRYGIEIILVDLPWKSGPLFDAVVEDCRERIVILETSFDAFAETLVDHGSTRFAIPTDDAIGYRFLSKEEMSFQPEVAHSGKSFR